MSRCSSPASPSPLASACLLLLLNFTSLCKQSAMRIICSVHKFPAFFCPAPGPDHQAFPAQKSRLLTTSALQKGCIRSKDTSAHSYLRTRADDRDAAEHLRVSEPQGNPALSPRNKDTQSTASLKPRFEHIKQLQIHGTAFSLLSCLPAYSQRDSALGHAL